MPETQFISIECAHALKEWAITGEALARNRQIVLLRKGGLLDEDGHFALEHSQFWLLPTWLHQERGLVKSAHQDLWAQTPREPDETAKIAYLRHFARVQRVWKLDENAESALLEVPHIWSAHYLDLRFGYQSDKTLLCAALRVYIADEPIRYALRAQDLGCRSWVDLAAPICAGVRPAIGDAEFASELESVTRVLENETREDFG